MSLIRSRCVSFFMVSIPLAAVACSSAEGASSSAKKTAESELSVTPSASAQSLTLSSTDGACTTVGSLLVAHHDELRALCADKQLPLPTDAVRDGCADGSVKSITFKCFDVQMPPPPPDGCQDMVVKDVNGAMCGSAAEAAASLPALLCPSLGGMIPPPPPPPPGAGAGGGAGGGVDGAQPPAPPPGPPAGSDPQPSNGSGSQTGSGPQPGAGPQPPQPGAGGPQPGGPGAPGGPPGPMGPPRFQCCAPPPPPPGGGGPGGSGGGGAPPAPSAPAPVQ